MKLFVVNKETILDKALLQKMINKFFVEVEPKLNKYKRYYDGFQAILNKAYADENKPCNKTVVNFCRNIVLSYVGYLSTPGCISYSSEQDIEEIMDILRYNDYQNEDSRFLQDALIYGVANELMYMDNAGKTRFKLINPQASFGVYDDSLTNDLLYFVRIYKADEWGDSDKHYVDVYSDYDVKHYSMSGRNGNLEAIGVEPHYFSQCPANILMLPDEKSIFDCVMSMCDSYNELISTEIDEFSQFADAYLWFEGADFDVDGMKAMREAKGFMLPPGAKCGYLTKSINDTQIENILKRLQDSIYRIAQCPDFSSENFVGGVSSGVSIRFKLSGMEHKAGTIESEMKKALQRRIEIICGIASLKYGEEVFRDIKIDFKRNIPEDVSGTINMINSLKGTVSDATLLAQLPFVDDVNAELEAVTKQKLTNMELYSFGNSTTTTEDSE